MKTAASCIIVTLFALAPIAASAEPAVNIFTDADTYQSGDTIEVSLSARNDSDGISVDAHIDGIEKHLYKTAQAA